MRETKAQRRQMKKANRGFTLTELMVVVVIVGILAAIGMVGYRKYIDSARSSEALQMINAIKSGQESFRAETMGYLNVSEGNLKAYYPKEPVANTAPTKYMWGDPTGPNAARWKMLNVSNTGPVLFGYATIAGAPGVVPPTGDLEVVSKPTFATAPEPWYIIQAKGNVDGDSLFSTYVSTSFTNEIYVENEGE